MIEGDWAVLVRRGHAPLKGEWSLPGGALELGETLQQGVVREVREETGLLVEAVSVIEVLDSIVVEDCTESLLPHSRRVRYHYVLIDYLCRVVEGNLRAASDAADARWVARTELHARSPYRLAPATVSVIERAFRMMENAPLHSSISSWTNR